jgi:hypothetical protein
VLSVITAAVGGIGVVALRSRTNTEPTGQTNQPGG